MLDAFTEINWIAVAISTVVAIALAGVYFGAIAAKSYVRVLGREGMEAPAPSFVGAVGPIVCLFVVVLTSAVLIAALGLTTAGDAIAFGLIAGIGYLLAMTFQIAINPNFPHPIRYGLLNAPFFLAVSLSSSLLLVLV